MDPPPWEPPPCICAAEGTTSAAAHTAAMAHWCRIQRIIALHRAASCQIFASPIVFVILSGAATSRCEVVAESKDPYELIGARRFAFSGFGGIFRPFGAIPFWLLLATAYAVGSILCAALRL